MDAGQRRKLTSILSADVAGYSRLMQYDDAATFETLMKYRTVCSDFVSRHEDRIVDSPGDNILAEFDSSVEAVQCAVEIQRELARRCNHATGTLRCRLETYAPPMAVLKKERHHA